MAASTRRRILVTGDFVLDHHIYEGARHHYGDRRSRGVQEVDEVGGAALVHYVLKALEGDVESSVTAATDESRRPALAPSARVPAGLSSYAVWRPFQREGDKTAENAVWRAAESMGFGGCAAVNDDAFRWPPAPDGRGDPDLVVISDGGMGFRNDSSAWPRKALDHAQWVVLKAAAPHATGALWDYLTEPARRERLVVVVSASDLRRSAAQVSRGLSWEATLESVLASLAPGGALVGLAVCRHLVVAFENEGGLWLDLGAASAGRVAHLVYDADVVEGDERGARKGTAFGLMSCLTAAVAWHLARGGPTALEDALEGGLSAMHDLLENGHGRAAVPGAGYPAARLAKVIRDATCRYARTVVPVTSVLDRACPLPEAPAAVAECWSLIHEALRDQGQGCPEPAWALAELVARRGPIALGSLPHLSLGSLVSADRPEIESLRVLRQLVESYKAPQKARKPLSIGVFGPPGAGKSFAVKELAKKLVGEDSWMEFNLSQFKVDSGDLIGALHQIRDRVLRGQVPVAFFDEFDSHDYAWLQFLLAPMQDGAFQEGQITHPVGKCILVFAGGTSSTFESFGPPEGDSEGFAKFKMAKGPDFKSRLDGFLDVLGPNRRDLLRLSADRKRYEATPDACDIFFPVRRAFIIRAEFGCGPADHLDMDPGVLRALLRTDRYRHGARSLAKVLEPLKVAHPGTVDRSSLPPTRQLALHVDPRDFMGYCRAEGRASFPLPVLDEKILGVVAPAIHEVWRALGKAGRWLDAKDDVDFPALHEFKQRSNRAAAERMASTLGLVGLALEPGTNTAAERERLRLKLEYHLELLAEAEHDGWMEWYLDQGWRWGPKKDEKERTHPCLRPYILLPDVERNKDRNTIRHYPRFADVAGMRIRM